MLVLGMRQMDRIRIGTDAWEVWITLVEGRYEKAQIGFEAPKEIIIERERLVRRRAPSPPKMKTEIELEEALDVIDMIKTDLERAKEEVNRLRAQRNGHAVASGPSQGRESQ